jgi:hypothetical protein
MDRVVLTHPDCHLLFDSTRRASTVMVTELTLAKACSQLDMVATGTKVELAKICGMMGTQPRSGVPGHAAAEVGGLAVEGKMR